MTSIEIAANRRMSVGLVAAACVLLASLAAQAQAPDQGCEPDTVVAVAKAAALPQGVRTVSAACKI